MFIYINTYPALLNYNWTLISLRYLYSEMVYIYRINVPVGQGRYQLCDMRITTAATKSGEQRARILILPTHIQRRTVMHGYTVDMRALLISRTSFIYQFMCMFCLNEEMRMEFFSFKQKMNDSIYSSVLYQMMDDVSVMMWYIYLIIWNNKVELNCTIENRELTKIENEKEESRFPRTIYEMTLCRQVDSDHPIRCYYYKFDSSGTENYIWKRRMF